MDPSACSERSRWAGLAVLAAAALAAAALIAPPAASAGVAAKPKPLPNLLVNPGAENGVPVPVVKNYRAFTTRGWTPMGYEAGGVVEVPPDASPTPPRTTVASAEAHQESKAHGERVEHATSSAAQHHRDADPPVNLAKYASVVDAGRPLPSRLAAMPIRRTRSP
jgi:hypothetical protein